MSLLVEPPFSYHSAASPQRSRLQIALARLSYEVSDFGKQVSHPKPKAPPPVKPADPKRFSIFKRKSFLSSLRKLLPKPSKTRNESNHVFDLDDGILDNGDIQLGLAQCEGGMPIELATSPLRMTYLLSVRKLKVFQNRPLHQLLLIHGIVSRLKLQVIDSLPSLSNEEAPHFSRLNLPPIRRRPVLFPRYSLSEPNLSLSSRPHLSKRASRSEETLVRPVTRSPHRLSNPCL